MSGFAATYTIAQERVRLTSQRPVRVAAMDQVQTVPPHDHEFCEVALVRRGTGTHRTVGGERRLQRGDLVVCKPGQVHAFDRCTGLAVYNMYYLAEAFVRDAWLLTRAPVLCTAFFGHHLFPGAAGASPIETRSEAPALELVIRELDFLATVDPAVDQPAVMRASLLKVLALLEPAVAGVVADDASPLRHPLVQHALACSERALADGLSPDIAGWAEQAGCSADHFTRRFKALVGETPSAFHQRRRLQHAADALIHSDAELTTIALDLGFSDSAHFTRSFRAAYGMPPSQWRRRFRAA